MCYVNGVNVSLLVLSSKTFVQLNKPINSTMEFSISPSHFRKLTRKSIENLMKAMKSLSM